MCSSDLGGQVGPGATRTPIVYAHATLSAGARVQVAWPQEFNGLIYCLGGTVRVGGDGRALGAHQLAVLDDGGATILVEVDETSDVLILGGTPLREPVAWYGPFVMNTREEIEQAFADYRATGFGGWPWDRPDPVHGEALDVRGGAIRFARHADGRFDRPEAVAR